METLYISQERCSVRSEGDHLRMVQSGRTLATVPLQGVKTIVLFDSVSITAPAMDVLAYRGIDVIYQSKWGKVKWRILSTKGSSVITRLAQYSAFMNQERRLEIAKTIVNAKIHNQLNMVKNYQHSGTKVDLDKDIAAIESFSKRLDGANSINEVMGLEGVSAKHYWNCFRSLLKNPVFTRREYRPSPDYVNALLNLGYSFLYNVINTCLIAKHFDLELGFLHSIHYGRNSLSLDIMEEFRPVFIDGWVLKLLNRKQLDSKHFHMERGDWRLTDDGFRIFCGLYHEHAISWQDRFREQGNRLKDALIKGEEYEPYRKWD